MIRQFISIIVGVDIQISKTDYVINLEGENRLRLRITYSQS